MLDQSLGSYHQDVNSFNNDNELVCWKEVDTLMDAIKDIITDLKRGLLRMTATILL